MAFLPILQFFNQPADLTVDGDESTNYPHGMLNFLWFMRREHHTHCRFRSALQHVLAFLVETCNDGIAFFECHYQRWERRAIIARRCESSRVRHGEDPAKQRFPILAEFVDEIAFHA